jgi:alpha-ribazole phosphatase
MRVLLIRHGRTQGNTERRYVGARTDEGLSAEGRAELAVFGCAEDVPGCAGKVLVVTSPMKRAVETAEIMFPWVADHVTVDELRETDFGIFEGKTYEELSSDPERRDAYQVWIDSGGIANIPGGESMEEARARSVEGFRKAVMAARKAGKAVFKDEAREGGSGDAAEECALIIVAHGGTVMSVMSSLFGGDYYDYYTGNGEGYTFRLEVDDAGDITAAGTYDRFCGRVRA